MTEGAANAKWLFDQERWAEAVPELEAAAFGRYCDDVGNRQLSEERLAIALYHLGDLNASIDLFVQISERRYHLRHGFTSIWLPKTVLMRCPSRRAVQAMALHEPRGIVPPPTPLRQEGYYAFRFVRGRGFLELGQYAEAQREFTVARYHPRFTQTAEECLEVVAERSK